MLCADTHTVAALQAQNARMLRVVADLHEAAGNNTAAAERRHQASEIADAVENQLYIKGKGYFGTLQPNGTVLPVRTCLDFMYAPFATLSLSLPLSLSLSLSLSHVFHSGVGVRPTKLIT